MNQREMPMLGETPRAKPIPAHEIERCESALDALQLCVLRAPYRKQYLIAELIGMKPAHFSKCINGVENFPPCKIEELEDVCQCSAFTQYQMMRKGFEQPPLNERERRRQDLLAQLAELDNDQREAG